VAGRYQKKRVTLDGRTASCRDISISGFARRFLRRSTPKRCSAYVKIDVARRAINNDPRFRDAKVLFVTGERWQESRARARYAEVERHPCTNRRRRVDAWRAVIDWTEEQVWDALRRWRIVPHPAYQLGWGRVSCMTCIFGDRDQWASVRTLDPKRFQRIARYEQQFGKTIKRGQSVVEQADSGRSFVDDAPRELIERALSSQFPAADFFLPAGQPWTLPAGAFKRCGGPS
jgi:3'-phosphoadenosine 5'-phosphosulfate sulfotransferase (PAPS reductase)/FAD synthetase